MIQRAKILLRTKPELILIPLFLFIYIFSLTFYYVEGDDATSVLYHALGRNSAIQRPYSSYQGMMDVILSVLPADETIVRVVAITIHAIFGIIFPMLIIMLARTFIPENKDKQYKGLLFFTVLLPFIVPEFIFFGLYYQCSTIALSLILIAHLIFKHTYKNYGKYNILKIGLAILIFSIGVCFRWDCGLYLFVILIDLLSANTNSLTKKNKIVKTISELFIIASLCGACVLAFIYMEGYSVKDIFFIAQFSQQLLAREGHKFSWLINIGSSLSLFTPFIVATFIIGLCILLYKRKCLLLFLLVIAYLPTLKLFYSEAINPRRVINTIPLMIVICYIGFSYVIEHFDTHKMMIGALVLLIVFIPWLIGIQIYSDATMWGPDFNVKRVTANGSFDEGKLLDVDNRTVINKIKCSFLGSGFAVPFEGPRPVWGYFSVILGGKWRQLITNQNEERDNMLAVAHEKNLPILQQDFGVLMINNLVRKGYITNDRKQQVEIDSNIFVRRFYKGNDTVVFVYPRNNFETYILDSLYLARVCKVLHTQTLGLYTYSTSMLMLLKHNYPNNVITYGSSTGEFTF